MDVPVDDLDADHSPDQGLETSPGHPHTDETEPHGVGVADQELPSHEETLGEEDPGGADETGTGDDWFAEVWHEAGIGEAGFAAVCTALLTGTGFAARDLARALDQLGVPALDRAAGLDGRTCSIALGELGADALVEHSDIDDLAERVTQGEEVLLTMGNEAVSIVSCDTDTGTVVLGGPATRTARLADLEQAWAAASYELVITLGQGRPTCVLPLDAGWANLPKQMAELGDSPRP